MYSRLSLWLNFRRLGQQRRRRTQIHGGIFTVCGPRQSMHSTLGGSHRLQPGVARLPFRGLGVPG
jgi:hypothetical protein